MKMSYHHGIMDTTLGNSTAWRDSKGTLSSLLRHCWEEGLRADVVFEVGQEKMEIIKAHKFILSLRSEVFEAMFSDKWNSAEGENITLPQNNPIAFRIFLHFLYTDEMDSSVELDILLEIMSLGKMYGICSVMNAVSDALTPKINRNNCVQVYEYCKLLHDPTTMEALRVIKGNMKELVKDRAYLSTGWEGCWTHETWKGLLKVEGYNDVKEIDIFRALLDWSKSKDNKAQVRTLMPLVRFPLITCELFGTEVVDSGLLSEEQTIHMLLFYTGNLRIDLHFEYRSRQIQQVATSTELESALALAERGSLIHLNPGNYCGKFEIRQDYVHLFSSDPPNTIISKEDEGEESRSFALYISGSHCTVNNVRFEDCERCFFVAGKKNKVCNISMKDIRYAVKIVGTDNSVDNVRLVNVKGKRALSMKGTRNLVSSFHSANSDCRHIFEVGGESNRIEDAMYDSTPSSQIDCRTGFYVKKGFDHRFNNLNSADIFNEDLMMFLNIGCRSVSISQMKSMMDVWVHGYGHKLINCQVESKVEVRGIGHSFEECEISEWDKLGE